jgi:hypothetical protein
MICDQCGGDMVGQGFPGLNGTRDNFGVLKAFTDEKTGKTIDNWKAWEKAGYRQPLDVIKNDVVRQSVKKKIKTIGKSRQKPLDNSSLPI